MNLSYLFFVILSILSYLIGILFNTPLFMLFTFHVMILRRSTGLTPWYGFIQTQDSQSQVSDSWRYQDQ